MFQTFPKCGPGFGYLLGQDPFFWNVPTLGLYPTHEMKALQVFPVFLFYFCFGGGGMEWASWEKRDKIGAGLYV
jgi:hypothetical protein